MKSWSPLADSGSENYLEMEPDPGVTAAFTVLVLFIHLSWIFILHEVSSRVPKPLRRLQDLSASDLQTGVDAKSLAILSQGEEGADAIAFSSRYEKKKVGRRSKEKLLIQPRDASPQHVGVDLGADDDLEEDAATLSPFIEAGDEFEVLPWYERYPKMARREANEFVEGVRDSGLWLTLFKSVTMAHFNMRYFVESNLLVKAGALKDDEDPEGGGDEPAQKADGNSVTTGLTRISNQRHWYEYAANFLRLWLAFAGVISFTLYFCFFWNLLVEFMIKSVTDLKDGSWLGFFALFFVLQVILWFTRRVWDSLKLMWFNAGDALRVKGVFYWRFSLFVLCLLFTVIESSDEDSISVSDTLFWQIMLRQMVLVGLWWSLLFIIFTLVADAYTYFMIIFKTPSNISLPDIFKILQEMNWLDVFFLKRTDAEETSGFRLFKRCLVTVVLVSAWACLIVGLSLKDDGKPILFVSISLFTYYLQIFGRRAKWKALYVLWSQHHVYTYFDHKLNNVCARKKKRNVERFIADSDKDFDDSFHELVYKLRPDYIQSTAKRSKESGFSYVVHFARNAAKKTATRVQKHVKTLTEPSIESVDTTDLKHESDAIAGVFEEMSDRKDEDGNRLLVVDSAIALSVDDANDDGGDEDEDDDDSEVFSADDLPDWLARFFDGNRMHTIRISWMEYWNSIEAEEKDFLGCSQVAKCSSSCCCTFAMLILSLFFVVWASRAGKVDTTKAADTNLNAIYPICNLQTSQGHTIMDLAFFTLSAYEIERRKPRRIYQQMEVWFGNDTVWNRWNKSSLFFDPSKPAFYSYDMVLEEAGIVAVRGTKTFGDVIQDISLYSEVVVLQSVSYVLPLTSLLPVGFLRDWVFAAAKPEGWIDPKARDKFDAPVLKYLKRHFDENQNRSIMVAGHSLGGAIAQIVAAKVADRRKTNKVFSFGLSSPGTIWTSEKFGFPVEALDKTALSVLPRRDPVANADLHGGLVQMIECDAAQSMQCHSSTRSFCELYANCGNGLDDEELGRLIHNRTFVECVCDLEDTTWAGCAGLVDVGTEDEEEEDE